jgi:hypothetical protein
MNISFNIQFLAALGITGAVGALDLTIKGIELAVDSFRFLEVGVKKGILIRHIHH